jgi:hypothetical protein
MHLPEYVQKCFLGQILCFDRISQHPRTKGIDVTTVPSVNEFEGRAAAVAGRWNSLGEGGACSVAWIWC